MNLLRDLPDASAAEVIETILAAPGVRVERIVSLGQASAEGFWYDQDEAEWVLLLAGAARLRFADEAKARRSVPATASTSPRIGGIGWTGPTLNNPLSGSPCSIAKAATDHSRRVVSNASRSARST
jgi:cupin 2 domain-containing protein